MDRGRYLLPFTLVVAMAWPAQARAQLTADRYSEGQPKSVAGCPAVPLAFHKCAVDKAKTFAPPRTPSGKPDMQGYWFGLLVSEYSVEAVAADDPRAQSGVEPWEVWPGMIVDPPDGQIPYQSWAAPIGRAGVNRQQYIDPADGTVVPKDEIVKGYEFAKDQYVLFTKEELEVVEAPKSDEIEIVSFVPAETVPRIFFNKAYYLGPDKGGARAYRLLAAALTDTGRVAIAKHATRGKQYIVMIRPHENGLLLEQLYYEDEIRSFEEVPLEEGWVGSLASHGLGRPGALERGAYRRRCRLFPGLPGGLRLESFRLLL